MATRHRAIAGFTLIEVMVAFAVAAILMVVLSRALGLGVVATARVKSQGDAVLIAESTLDSMGTVTPLKDGDTADLDEGGYHIHATVDRYVDPARPTSHGYLALYRVRATVMWREARQRRSLTLTTLRLARPG
ncbi:MAG TPA: type II secretion system protein [Stellaceae bacterium]|nr:type II secretion system protein [Stellaceae bacterium]